ncbi:MAG TPA: hypothetical protein VHW09_18145 [Bryobacteraceae bacterium]|nr:hypothetical protein [Bryobacteraceae bacterium]
MNFSTRILAGSDAVAGHERRIDYASDPLAGIAAFYGNFAIHQTDTGDAVEQIFAGRRLRAQRGGSHGEKQRYRRR